MTKPSRRNPPGYSNDARACFVPPKDYVEKALTDPAFEEQHTEPTYITPKRIEWAPAQGTIRRRAAAIWREKFKDALAATERGEFDEDAEEEETED